MACSCVSSKQADYRFNNKKSSTALKADLFLLQKILEANHPSLYWYTSKDSLDTFFNSAINSINDSLTEVEFKNKVASVVSKIRCGHTSVRSSKNFLQEQEKNKFPQFPLFFKTWNDSLVVLANVFSKDSILKRGTIVTAINGRSNSLILNKMFDVISTDGYSDNFKSQAISSNFPLWYKYVIGLDSVYAIEYIDSTGQKAIVNIKNFIPAKPVKNSTAKKDTLTKPNAVVFEMPTKKQLRQAKLLGKRSMQIDTSINTAYIRLNTFSGGRLRTFFRKTFATIKEKNIENVVIDLRENGGGNVALSTKLARYIATKPFKNGDSVFAISRTFPKRYYIKNWWMYWIPMNFFAKKQSDGKIHSTRFEKHFFEPISKNHFDGKVFLVQGGFTFSASTMFVSTLKGQSNVTIVGEETGGGYYGNSAMHLPYIVLPNSKLRIGLPMYRLVMDKTRPKGNGIMPDIFVPPSSKAIKKGIDIKLAVVRKLILEKSQPK